MANADLAVIGINGPTQWPQGIVDQSFSLQEQVISGTALPG